MMLNSNHGHVADPETNSVQLRPDQQTALIARLPLEQVLTEIQQQYLKLHGRVTGDITPMTQNGRAIIHALEADGKMTYQFVTSTLSSKWHLHVFVHPSSGHLARHNKSRSKVVVHGAVLFLAEPDQKEGLLGEVHLVADGLSELTVVHEAVHAAGCLARTLGVVDAKRLAASYTKSQSTIMWREEIQCRTVEIITMRVIQVLEVLRIPCKPLRISTL